MQEISVIKMIAADKLHPHPDNPRKNVGDVSELAESIKANGILQNLTVVPYFSKAHDRVMEGLYTVIIGHRRFAAAQMAGLTELPCVIANMTEKEQLSTMLTENMQRVDLTAYEQAQGFQMMFDLGDSVEEIAKKSGFSESTVRRRLEMAKLDGNALKRVSSRQISIGDFDELAKIHDINVRNKLLGSIGTANFKNELQSALKDQKLAAKMEEWLAEIKKFAVEAKDGDGKKWIYVEYYGSYSVDRDVRIPDDRQTAQYGYKVGKKDITVYKAADLSKAAQEEAAREERRCKEEEVRLRYEDVNDRHYDLRCDFVKGLSNAECKRHSSRIFGFAADAMYKLAETYGTSGVDLETLGYLLGIKVDKTKTLTDNEGVRSALESFPEKTLFCLSYCIKDDHRNGYWQRVWNCGKYAYQHRVNEELDELYELLEALGYEMSNEEKEMQSGDHELFLPG